MKQIEPLVSVIIPMYNAEKYIEDTLQSVFNQTWQNIEIIIVDDSSTDQSLYIVQKYTEQRVKILTQENKGASAARNYGLQEAKGEYIQFLDADDLLSPDKISSQIQLLIVNPGYLGLCCTVHFKNGDDPLTYSVDHGWMEAGSDDPADFLIKLYGAEFIGPEYGSMVQTNAWLTPKHLINEVGPWDEMRCPDDDGEFFCRVLLAGKGIKYSHQGVNYYRKFDRESSWSAKKDYESFSNILRSNLLKAEYLTAKTSDPRAGIALSRLFCENAFNSYPYFRDLSAMAEKKAKELAPGIKYKAYKTKGNALLADIFNWKTVKYLQYLKHRLLS